MQKVIILAALTLTAQSFAQTVVSQGKYSSQANADYSSQETKGCVADPGVNRDSQAKKTAGGINPELAKGMSFVEDESYVANNGAVKSAVTTETSIDSVSESQIIETKKYSDVQGISNIGSESSAQFTLNLKTAKPGDVMTIQHAILPLVVGSQYFDVKTSSSINWMEGVIQVPVAYTVCYVTETKATTSSWTSTIGQMTLAKSGQSISAMRRESIKQNAQLKCYASINSEGVDMSTVTWTRTKISSNDVPGEVNYCGGKTIFLYASTINQKGEIIFKSVYELTGFAKK